MIATIKLERYVTHASVFRVVVGKLYYWQKLCLVILLPIHKGTKVSFDHAILLFCLPVCLKVECYKELLFDAQEIT